MQLPRADSDLLMFLASVRRSPSAPVRDRRSEPARSTRCILPNEVPPLRRSVQVTCTEKMQWLRLLWLFMLVELVERLRMPMLITCSTSSMLSTGLVLRSVTKVPPLGSFFTSSFFKSPFASCSSIRSLICSL